MNRDTIQNEALLAHETFGFRSTIAMSMGLGKTRIAIRRIMEHLKNNINSKIIVAGARTVFLENFQLELKALNLEKFISQIIFSTTKSLGKYENILFDLVIIDEAHKECERIYQFLKKQNELSPTSEFLCLTGSPKRFSFEENSIYDFAPISYRKRVDESIELDLLNDYQITVLFTELDTRNNIKVDTKNYSFFTSEKKQYDYLYKKYLDSSKKGFSYELSNLKQFFRKIKSKDPYVLQLLSKFRNEKTLIFLNSIDKTYEYDLPSYHSKLSKEIRTENLLKFINSDILHFTNVDGLTESINVPQLKNLIITKIDASELKFLQALGRALRLLKDQTANVFVICAKNTIEVDWLRKAISSLDRTKITAINIENYDFTTK